MEFSLQQQSSLFLHLQQAHFGCVSLIWAKFGHLTPNVIIEKLHKDNYKYVMQFKSLQKDVKIRNSLGSYIWYLLKWSLSECIVLLSISQ